MSFAQLYSHVENLRLCPVNVETVIAPQVKALASQDDIFFTKVDLDPEICFGYMKQYRDSTGVYAEPSWVTDIRYYEGLNLCWRRYVCCKELMHVFDKGQERVISSEVFGMLLADLEAPPPSGSEVSPYSSEVRAEWMALAVLCPLPLRDALLARQAVDPRPSYDLALELRVPEGAIATILSDRFPIIVNALLGR